MLANHQAGPVIHLLQPHKCLTKALVEMLDMAQDNWVEMLLNRVQNSLAGGKEKLEFLLNPRNLGKMKVTWTAK